MRLGHSATTVLPVDARHTNRLSCSCSSTLAASSAELCLSESGAVDKLIVFARLETSPSSPPSRHPSRGSCSRSRPARACLVASGRLVSSPLLRLPVAFTRPNERLPLLSSLPAPRPLHGYSLAAIDARRVIESQPGRCRASDAESTCLLRLPPASSPRLLPASFRRRFCCPICATASARDKLAACSLCALGWLE